MNKNDIIQDFIDSIGTNLHIFDIVAPNRFRWAMINKSAEEYYGTVRADYIGRELGEFEGVEEIKFSHRRKLIQAFQHCVEKKANVVTEQKYKLSNGETRWTRHTITPMFSTNGELTQLSDSITDITGWVQSRKRLQLTIDAIGEPIILIQVTKSGRFKFGAINEKATQFFGISAEDLKGNYVDSRIQLSDRRNSQRDNFISILNQCVETKQTIPYEVQHQMLSGQLRWIRSTQVPIFAPDKTIRQIMITCIDINELVETQKRLEDTLTKTLSGFVKICASCKMIKHKDQWQEIEQYASEQMDYHQFSHGLCSTCASTLYEE